MLGKFLRFLFKEGATEALMDAIRAWALPWLAGVSMAVMAWLDHFPLSLIFLGAILAFAGTASALLRFGQ